MAMALLSSAPSLVSCSGEGSPDDPSSVSLEPTVTIKVFTPVLTRGYSATRAEGETTTPSLSNSAVSNAETRLSSLYLFIYDAASTEEDAKPFKFVNCSAQIDDLNKNNLSAQYTGIYQAPIKAGKYRFYVLANVDGFLSTDEGQSVEDYLSNLSEEELTKLQLTFSSFISLADENAVLPMFVPASEMTVYQNTISPDTDGSVDLSNLSGTSSVTIQGEMTILCAKVRYTFLFDNHVTTTSKADNTTEETDYGFSYPYTSFEVTNISLKNLTASMPLMDDANWSDSNDLTNTADLPGSHYPYPTTLQKEDKTPLFSSIEDFIKTPIDLSGKAEKPGDCRAYQGTVYLPENCNTNTSDGKTIMRVAMNLSDVGYSYNIILPTNQNEGCDEDLDHTPATPGENILKRGHFYDIIGKITSTGMHFYVKVNPWVDTERETFDF